MIWPANAFAAATGVALLLIFPHLAHPYVVGLPVASVGGAVFAALEWATGPRQ